MTLGPGTRLGSYEIIAPLGAGGMGEVYRACDTRLRRDVALKVLPEAYSGDAARLARFEQEARTVAGLNHPNIVTLFSVEKEGSVHFLTMELVEGRTLDREIATGGLPLARLLELALPLSEALVAAHARNVVHRDLKPANVMVGDDGRVKVLDFGLAKLSHEDPALDATQARTLASPLSGEGQVMGTVPYMSPEQLRGEPVDARTDLFAFGTILFELASGTRPFAGASSADVSSAILRDEPPPLAKLRSDLPGELHRIVGRCLEKTPRDRFQYATEVRDELRALKRTLESGPQTTANAAAHEVPSIAVLPFSNMSADPENEFFSDGLSEELLNSLAKIPELKVTGRTSCFAFKGKHEDLREIGQKLGVATLLEGSVRKAGNRVRITAQLIKVSDGFHLWSETYDRVLDDIFAVQDDIARAVSSALRVTLLKKAATAIKMNARSYELILRANHFALQTTRESLASAVTLYRQAIAESPEDARAWAGMAKAHAYQAFHGHIDVHEGRQLARKAAERALELDDDLPDAHEAMGWILASLEFRWKEAAGEVRRALLLAPGASGPLSTMATYEAFRGQIVEALRMAREALELDPLHARAHTNLARIEMLARDYKSASESFLRALELSPGMTAAHSSRGICLLELGLGEEALAEIELEPSAGYRYCSLAIICHHLGRQEQSDAALAGLIAEGEQWGYQIAMVCARRGEHDQAFEWLEKSYELHDSGIAMTKVQPIFDVLHSDSRWPKFLEKIGLADSAW